MKDSITKHAAKSKKAVEARKAKVIEAIIDGATLTEAGIQAGFSPQYAGSQASRIVNDPQMQESFIRTLEERGLTNNFLAMKAYELLEAEQYHFFSKNGVVTDTKVTPARETQRKTLELVARMKGLLKDAEKGGDINLSLMQTVVNVVNNSDDQE